MIAETVFVMTILGCGNEGDACDFVAEPKQTYISQLECEAAVEKILPGFQDAAYPVLVGDCMQKPNAVQIAQLGQGKVQPAQNLKQTVPDEASIFDRLRANADSIEFDPIGQTKAVLVRATDATKGFVGRLRNGLRGG